MIETEALQFLAAPFVMCLVLIGIHCYLGLHVLARGVIFVDLSLAQVASFGATIALFWDPDHKSQLGYVISLVSTFCAAGIFALARRQASRFSQEAIIGLTFALASAAVILVVDRMAHGSEHIKEALIGQILWVSWSDVAQTAAIYAGVAAVHWSFRSQLMASSFGSEPAHWKWDFVFYALFGIVITSSTHTAGVLLVFAFLIVPSIVSQVFYDDVGRRLAFGWIFGGALAGTGLLASHIFDLPAGAVIVVFFTVVPLILLLLAPLLPQRRAVLHD